MNLVDLMWLSWSCAHFNDPRALGFLMWEMLEQRVNIQIFCTLGAHYQQKIKAKATTNLPISIILIK